MNAQLQPGEKDHRVPTNAELLIAIRELHTKLKAHIDDEAELKPKLLDLLSYMEQAKGAYRMLSWLVALGTPISAIGAFLYWLKDHLK